MKQQKQSGFAHLMIITLILGVALVGTLGYVFYQNFIVKKDDVSKIDKSSKDNAKSSDKSPVIEEDKNTFKIKEWNIKGIYKGSHPIRYTIGVGSKYYASFMSDDLTGHCSGWSAANIARFTGDLTVKSVFPWSGVSDDRTVAEEYAVDSVSEWAGNKHIGDYYYIYISPHQGCATSESDSNNAISIQVSNDVHEYFKTLESF